MSHSSLGELFLERKQQVRFARTLIEHTRKTKTCYPINHISKETLLFYNLMSSLNRFIPRVKGPHLEKINSKRKCIIELSQHNNNKNADINENIELHILFNATPNQVTQLMFKLKEEQENMIIGPQSMVVNCITELPLFNESAIQAHPVSNSVPIFYLASNLEPDYPRIKIVRCQPIAKPLFITKVNSNNNLNNNSSNNNNNNNNNYFNIQHKKRKVSERSLLSSSLPSYLEQPRKKRVNRNSKKIAKRKSFKNNTKNKIKTKTLTYSKKRSNSSTKNSKNLLEKKTFILQHHSKKIRCNNISSVRELRQEAKNLLRGVYRLKCRIVLKDRDNFVINNETDLLRLDTNVIFVERCKPCFSLKSIRKALKRTIK